MSKVIKGLIILLGVTLVIGLMGSLVLAGEKELTPYEWFQLTTKDKLKYKTVEIRAGRTFIEEDIIENAEKAIKEGVHGGDVWMPIDMYSKTLFEIYHPKVKIIGVSTPWLPPDKQVEKTMSELASGSAPSFYKVYYMGGPQTWIKKGLAADITDLVEDWDQAPHMLSTIGGLWEAACWKDGRCYSVPGLGIPARCNVFQFRRDWFKEIGIFNEEGKPGPSDNWTWNDFREIAKKLTDSKKKRWGWAYGPTLFQSYSEPFCIYFGYGGQPYIVRVPDKSGKYTWRFEVTPPLIKTLEFMKDMIWKDKSVVTTSDATIVSAWKKDFNGGRAGMDYGCSNWFMGDIVNQPYLYSKTIPTSEFVGIANIPKGIYGLMLNTISTELWGFDPTLNKEQLKAAFEWIDWNEVGRGKTLSLERSLDLLKLNKRYYPLWDMISDYVGWHYKIREIPKGMPVVTEFLPVDTLKTLAEGIKIPSISSCYGPSGLTLSRAGEEEKILTGLFQTIVSNPNVNVQTELKKTGDLLNSTVYNEKIENDAKLLKEYYTQLDSFYKKYYPEWYSSKEYKKLFEEYYKCW